MDSEDQSYQVLYLFKYPSLDLVLDDILYGKDIPIIK